MGVKILLVVIDAATPHVVCPAIRYGRLPIMRQLAERGTLHEASATIFPSITPAATTSIVTGVYPSEHGVAGASWFDQIHEEIAYYGDDFWVIARQGFGEFVRDFLLRLNGDRLQAPTMFEMAERAGRLAACLNYLVFKGNFAHRVNIPGLMAALPGVPFTETIEGPSTLCLGDFVGTPTPHGHRLREKGGLLHRFGMDDASTGALLRDLMAVGPLPDFTVAYFADNDYRSHEVGPFAALPIVERVDEMLGVAFEAGGGLERVLEKTIVVITSDHGHCDVLPDRAAAIHLDRLLGDFTQAALGRAWRPHDEIMICPNMRAAQVYFQKPTPESVQRAVSAILSDARVDQAIWRTLLTRRDASGYTVASSAGRVEFSRDIGEQASCVDAFGGVWACHGDDGPLRIEHDGRTVLFNEYPNAFERIAGALDLDSGGDLWVTARPGYEFEVPGGEAHVGGASHGALHALDSLSPVLVSGGPVPVKLPRALRSVDIAPLCMDLLGIPMRYRVGDARP